MNFLNEKIKKGSKIHLVSFHKHCENSSYLLSRIKKFFEINGYEINKDISKSDIIITDFCSVVDEIKEKNELFISNLVKNNLTKKIFVFGCIIDNYLKKLDLIIIPSREIDKFDDYFETKIKINDVIVNELFDFEFLKFQNLSAKDNYVMISQGCLNNCTYCNIKIAKGGVKSKPISLIKKELTELIKKRKFEITLLSDDCGSYGQDIGTDIYQLIFELLNMDTNIKIKIYEIFPSLFIKYYPKLKKFFSSGRITFVCIPIQAGSSKILKLMNRKYNLKCIKRIINEIKKISPKTKIFTHFIINFPTESLADFRESVNVAKIFDFCNFLPYGENKNTAASKIRPKCSSQELKIKINLVNKLIKKKKIKGFIGYTPKQ